MGFVEVTLSLLEGFGVTCLLFLLTLLLALPLGLLIAFGSMSKFRPLSWVTRTFVWVIRGTPLMLQLIVVMYVPSMMFGVSPFDIEALVNVFGPNVEQFIAAVVAFVINYACYFSEIYRGGIESIPRGQYEAAEVLGMTARETFFSVILMQVIKRILAPMSNEVITLVKDTSLARIITYYELIYFAQRYIKNGGILWPLFYTAVYYLAFTALLTFLFRWIEKKLDYFKA